MNIGTFTLIKNEARWIDAHIGNVLPHLDQMVFFDGNSTDGTLDIIERRQSRKGGFKIKLFKNKDPEDLQENYVRLFNECLNSLETNLAWFLHPDMFVENPEQIGHVINNNPIAAYTHLKSFAGEPGGPLLRITSGRGELWKNIYRLRNPDLGAHYHGFYGADNEDVYFSSITGNQHDFHGQSMRNYPYEVFDSKINVLHFSDVRPYERRLDRMIKSMTNQGLHPKKARKEALEHPRVTLNPGDGFQFVPANYPDYLQ